ETQAYQTYLGFATGATPPKKAQKFKKPGSPKLTTVSVLTEAPTRKLKIGNDEDDSNNEQVSNDEEKDSDDDKTQSDNENELDSEHETDESESGSESDHDEINENEEYGDDDETKIIDKAKGDKDKEMDYTTSQLYDDVDIRLHKPVNTDKGFVQEEGTDAAMTNVQQGNKNIEIL
nr:hypothetical protein [Tanacetum cinerariifolium]